MPTHTHACTHTHTHTRKHTERWLYTYCIAEKKLTVIKPDGLPSKCVLLILTGYNLTDWTSTTVWYDNYNIIINY